MLVFGSLTFHSGSNILNGSFGSFVLSCRLEFLLRKPAFVNLRGLPESNVNVSGFCRSANEAGIVLLPGLCCGEHDVPVPMPALELCEPWLTRELLESERLRWTTGLPKLPQGACCDSIPLSCPSPAPKSTVSDIDMPDLCGEPTRLLAPSEVSDDVITLCVSPLTDDICESGVESVATALLSAAVLGFSVFIVSLATLD